MNPTTTLLVTPFLLLLLLLMSAVGPTQAGADGPDGPRPPNCKKVVCSRALCADPVTPPGKCCPSCAGSKCKFEGCVQLRPTLRWLPEPCKICFCRDGKTLCGAIGCPGFPGPDPCFGRPFTKVGSTPSVCCPRCDFGVPETSCRAVPYRRMPYTLKQGGKTCSRRVTLHRCDKQGYRKDGKIFRCQAVRLNRYVSIGGCDPFTRIAYRDTRYCRAVQDDSFSSAEGCDFIVRPKPPIGPPPGPPGPPGSPGPR